MATPKFHTVAVGMSTDPRLMADIILPPDHHQPRNEACGHNIDPRYVCTCKKVKNRKGYRVCRVTDAHAPAGVESNIVLEVHPGGLLVFREKGRRRRYQTTAGSVFAGLVWKEAKAAAAAKKAKRRAR